MASQSYPTVNGDACSWADISVDATLNGSQNLNLVDVQSVKWKRDVEVGEKRGTSGGRVTATTAGSLKQEASFVLYRAGLIDLITALAAVAPRRANQAIVSAVRFTVVVQHTPIGDTRVYTTRLKGCRYLGDSDDMKESSDADVLEVTLNPIEIVNVLADGTEVVLR